MKYTKKLFSAMLVLAMAMALTLPAAAASGAAPTRETTYSIKIKNDNDGHIYDAYQIFTGNLHIEANGDAVLSNIDWGTGVNVEAAEAAYGNAAEKAKTITEATAKAFAEELNENAYLAGAAASSGGLTELTLADGSKAKGYEINGLKPGYYLVKDRAGTLAGGHDAYTSYILQVVRDVEAAPKSAVPGVDKQVHDEPGDAEYGAADGWGETADHAINESFQFKLTAALPADENFADYDTYKVVFTDTMSKGVTFESIESVTVNDTIPVQSGSAVSDYQITAPVEVEGGAKQWTLTIEDIKSIAGITLTGGVKIEVIYNAHLNEEAFVNNTPGATDNRNQVYLEFSNNPNAAGLGKTTEDSVWVFTYEVSGNKVDGDKMPLAGAEFKLYTAVPDPEDTEKLVPDEEIPVVWDADMNAYRLARMVDGEMEPGVAISTAKTGEGAEEKQSFTIRGLDDGIYFLVETKTPEGYNTCAPVRVVIDAKHMEDGDAAGATVEFLAASAMDHEIENNKGTVLPGTGGIGTTIFYVVGGILVIGAAILLIAKKCTKI